MSMAAQNMDGGTSSSSGSTITVVHAICSGSGGRGITRGACPPIVD